MTSLNLPDNACKFIDAEHKEMSVEQMAEITGLFKKDIRTYCIQNGLHFFCDNAPEPLYNGYGLTECDMRFIRLNRMDMTIREMANELSADTKRIRYYLDREGLNYKRAHQTPKKRYERESEILKYVPKKVEVTKDQRPPAVYTNKSPMGIADHK